MSELRKLAEDALSLNEPWWDLGDDRVSMSFCDQDAAYIAAANPTIVIGLLDEIERLTAERDAAIADAKRYRWLCENGDADGGLFIGTGRNGTWGECGHSAYHYKEHADAAIDKAMKGEQS